MVNGKEQESNSQKRTTFRGNLMNHIIRGSMNPIDEAKQINNTMKPPKPEFIDRTQAINNGSIVLDAGPTGLLDYGIAKMC